jgi:hypothetical protein
MENMIEREREREIHLNIQHTVYITGVGGKGRHAYSTSLTGSICVKKTSKDPMMYHEKEVMREMGS